MQGRCDQGGGVGGGGLGGVVCAVAESALPGPARGMGSIDLLGCIRLLSTRNSYEAAALGAPLWGAPLWGAVGRCGGRSSVVLVSPGLVFKGF